jgi:asparagine synthase (glutamine-hydrolysing)
MSGIAGIIYLNQQDLSTTQLLKMKHKLIHRGIDGINLYLHKNIGLLHLMLHVTPESIGEQQPFTSKAQNTITADARIDNRNELIEELSLKPTYSEYITDSEIILAAYEYWQDDCLYHLIGDFAFAIWDEKKQQLFCGRDHMGVRPFYYYHKEGEVFAFASEIKALLALDFVPHDINYDKVAKYLSWLSDNVSYTEETFYENIVTIQPAFTLKVDKHGIKKRFCWDFNLSRFNYLTTKQDFIEAFKKLFVEAVKRRVNSAYKIASHLSGGLDSSSIVCVAGTLMSETLITLHDVTGFDSTDETFFAKTVIKNRNLKHFWVKPIETFWTALKKINVIFDRPEHFNIASQRQLAQAEIISTEKCRILLSGHDGDTVLSYGTKILTKHLREKKWNKFNKKLEMYVKNADFSYNIPTWNQLSFSAQKKIIGVAFVERLIIEYLKNYDFKSFLILINNVKSFCGITYSDFLESIGKKALNKIWNREKLNKSIILGGKLIGKQNIASQNKLLLSGLTPQQEAHFYNIYSSGIIDINEQFNHIGAYYSFEPRYPFLDKHLIELCLTIPPEYNFGEGKLRDILRESMKDYLPEEVYQRTTKIDLSDYVYQVFTKKIDFLKYCQHSIGCSDWINFKNVKNTYLRMINEDNLEKKYHLMWKICRIPYLITWLSQIKQNNDEQKETVPKTTAHSVRKSE